MITRTDPMILFPEKIFCLLKEMLYFCNDEEQVSVTESSTGRKWIIENRPRFSSHPQALLMINKVEN